MISSVVLFAATLPQLFALECGVVTRKSENVHGVGVFATKDYLEGEVIEKSFTIMMPTENTKYTLLDEYVFGHVEEYADVVLGYAMVYNHHANSNVQVTSSEILSKRIPSGEYYRDFVIYAKRDIKAGEELFSSYGNEQWFRERDKEYFDIPDRRVVDHTVNSFPGCPYGLTEMHDGRLYASERIHEGDVIEVSRALLMDPQVTRGTAMDNYVWRSNYGHSVMVLLGTGASYRGRTDTEASNISYDWFPEEGLQPGECNEKMLVVFTAVRDIEVNEELIIDLFHSEESDRIAVFPSGECF